MQIWIPKFKISRLIKKLKNRADAAAPAHPPSEAKGGLCRGSIVGAVESAIFRVQIDQLPGHSRTRFIFF